MPKKKSPPPVFEVLFVGADIYPEKIPIGTLARTLSAIQRLATGRETVEEDEEGEGHDDSSIGLLDVKRGSAVFRFVGASPLMALGYLRDAGKALNNPESFGERDYLLGPIERLSATAKSLHCSIVVRESGAGDEILAKIEPTSFERISKSLFVKGETAVTGEVKRVGGATEIRCGLRVPFQHRMLFCKVATQEVARELGDSLYKKVVAEGEAVWIKTTWKIVEFTINGVRRLREASLLESLKVLREAGGSGWDDVDDPQAYLEEVTGQ